MEKISIQEFEKMPIQEKENLINQSLQKMVEAGIKLGENRSKAFRKFSLVDGTITNIENAMPGYFIDRKLMKLVKGEKPKIIKEKEESKTSKSQKEKIDNLMSKITDFKRIQYSLDSSLIKEIEELSNEYPYYRKQDLFSVVVRAGLNALKGE